MDILNLATGQPNTPDTLQQACSDGVEPSTNNGDVSQQVGFGEALLSVSATLIPFPHPDASTDVVSPGDIEDNSEEKFSNNDELVPENIVAPAQLPQLLESLLVSSPMSVRTQSEPTVTHNPSFSPSFVSLVVVPQPAQGSVAPVSDAAVPVLASKTLSYSPQIVTTLAAANTTPVVTHTVNTVPSTTAQFSVTSQNTPLTVNTEDSRWTQQLQSALGERLQIQVKNQIQHATIRLDPPELGKIDIALQVENGRVQVHINASHAEIYRALQQTSNDLRQSLIEQNYGQVNVQVSTQTGQQQERGRTFAEQQPVSILAENDVPVNEQDRRRRDDDSILLTV